VPLQLQKRWNVTFSACCSSSLFSLFGKRKLAELWKVFAWVETAPLINYAIKRYSSVLVNTPKYVDVIREVS
jgi:hypothetical protein